MVLITLFDRLLTQQSLVRSPNCIPSPDLIVFVLLTASLHRLSAIRALRKSPKVQRLIPKKYHRRKILTETGSNLRC